MRKFRTIDSVERELISLMQDTAEMGATQALVAIGKIPQYINKSEAYRRVGSRRKVEKWIREGVLKVTEAGIDQTQLIAISASANLYVHTKVLKK